MLRFGVALLVTFEIRHALPLLSFGLAVVVERAIFWLRFNVSRKHAVHLSATLLETHGLGTETIS